MTKSTITSQPSRPIRRTARISVKPLWSNQSINLSYSSSDEFTSPIKNEHFLNLASQSPSPNEQNELTPPHTKSPIDPTPPSAPTQPSKTPSPSPLPKIEPMELFGSPPTSPHPFVQDLNDLPPRPTQPPPFANQSPRSILDLDEDLNHTQPPQQVYHQPKPLLFHPIYHDIHGPLYGEPNFQNHDHPTPPHSKAQTFESFFPLYEEIQIMVENHLHQAMDFQTTLLDSIPIPSSTQELKTNQPSNQERKIKSYFPKLGQTASKGCLGFVWVGKSIQTFYDVLECKTGFILELVKQRFDDCTHLLTI
jgi:hypothetical protein